MADGRTVADLLKWVEADLGDLPDLEQLRAEDPEAFELDAVVLEWPNWLGMLTGLYEAYRSEQMTAGERERFRRLAARVTEALPVMERLGLERPVLPLEEVLREQAATRG